MTWFYACIVLFIVFYIPIEKSAQQARFLSIISENRVSPNNQLPNIPMQCKAASIPIYPELKIVVTSTKMIPHGNGEDLFVLNIGCGLY